MLLPCYLALFPKVKEPRNTSISDIYSVQTLAKFKPLYLKHREPIMLTRLYEIILKL